MLRLTALSTLLSLAACAGDGAATDALADRDARPRAVSADEQARTIAAMKPPKRARPLVAVLAQNDGAETTDYIIPYSVLAESGVADVVALATEDRALQLTPALTVAPQATTAAFEAMHPRGADYVIVPRIDRRDDPTLLAFIRSQAAGGAVIVGICAGALTVSSAGLLEGRDATSHWKEIEKLQQENPTMRYVPDRRYVVDRGVITTTGVSASLPVSIALVEAIAGRERAQEVATRLGVTSWGLEHDSAAFQLDGRMTWTALGNAAALWAHDTFGIDVDRGVDELSLAFASDAWSRTFRSRAVTVATSLDPVRTRRGLVIIPDRVRDDATPLTMLPPPDALAPARTLADALDAIEDRYGRDTAAFVALQLEYARSPNDRAATVGATTGPVVTAERAANHGAVEVVVTTSPARPRSGEPVRLTFTFSAGGTRLVDFDTVHERKLHLLMVTQDLSWFAHEHPQLQDDGTFTIDTTFPNGGTHRLFADLKPANHDAVVLGRDIHVDGAVKQAVPLRVGDDGARRIADGREVRLIADSLTAGRDAQLRFAVTQDGRPATDLEPYLGAMAHLVIIPEDAQTLLHAHPDDRGDAHGTHGSTSTPGSVAFHARFPAAGLYKAWAQFQVNGEVITADFVLNVHDAAHAIAAGNRDDDAHAHAHAHH